MIYKLTTSFMYSVLVRYKCLHCYNYTICQVRAMPVPVPDILLALESLNLMNLHSPRSLITQRTPVYRNEYPGMTFLQL